MRPTIWRSTILTRPFRFTTVARHHVQIALLILSSLKDDFGAVRSNLRCSLGGGQDRFLAALKILQQKVIAPSISHLVPISRNGRSDIPIGTFSKASDFAEDSSGI